MAKRMDRDFYRRCTIDVARDLIGQVLVHELPDGTRLRGRIVETEAYLGLEDPSCHSFGGRRTKRTEVMFGPPGLSYIYFIYGNHFCFNVVTMEREIPEAVLIRALEPLEGIEKMCEFRGRVLPAEQLANGPGKLCAAMNLERRQNGWDLCTHPSLWIEEGLTVEKSWLVEGPRIGIGFTQDCVHWPLRFGWKNHPALSPPKFPDYGQ